MSVYANMARYASETGGRTLDKNHITGMENGFVFTLYTGGDMSDNLLRVTFSVTHAGDAAQQSLLDRIRSKDVKERLMVQSVAFSPDGFRVVFTMSPAVKSKNNDFGSIMTAALREFSALLRAAGYQPGCACCGAQGVYSLTHVEDMFIPLCDGCFAVRVQEAEARETSKLNGSYLTGFVGALAGSLLGIFVYIVISAFGFVAAVAGIVTAVCTAKGYSMMKGRVGYGTPVIVLLTATVSIIGSVWMQNGISICLAAGLPFLTSLNQAWSLFFTPGVAGKTWFECLLPGAFCIVGVVPIAISMLRGVKSNARIPERII